MHKDKRGDMKLNCADIFPHLTVFVLKVKNNSSTLVNSSNVQPTVIDLGSVILNSRFCVLSFFLNNGKWYNKLKRSKWKKKMKMW